MLQVGPAGVSWSAPEGHLGQVLASSVTSSRNNVMQLAGMIITMHIKKLETLPAVRGHYTTSCTAREHSETGHGRASFLLDACAIV